LHQLIDNQSLGSKVAHDHVYVVSALHEPAFIRKCHPVNLAYLGSRALTQLPDLFQRWDDQTNAGLRVDFASGNTDASDASDPFRGRRQRVSPEVTFLPSEFSKIRLQYNYDDRDLVGVDHSIWLQFEFLLGAHAAHKF